MASGNKRSLQPHNESRSNERVASSDNIFRKKSKKHLSIGQYIVGKYALVSISKAKVSEKELLEK